MSEESKDLSSASSQQQLQDMIAEEAGERGLTVLGWRHVKVDNNDLGALSPPSLLRRG